MKNKLEMEYAKALNHVVCQNNFVDEDTNEYIYASLSQPPIKIIDKCNSEDELDFVVECPNCKSHVCYGTDTFMYEGHIYCSHKSVERKL